MVGEIRLPEFHIFYHSKQVKNGVHPRLEAPIISGPRPDIFYAHFEEDDVDFEIEIQNKSHDRCVKVQVEVQGKSFPFVLTENSHVVLTCLKSNGGKLHFIRQSGEDGESMVCLAAEAHDLDIQTAAIFVSRIKFKVQLSEQSSPFTVTVQQVNGKIFDLQATVQDTVDSLKSKIAQVSGIEEMDQILCFYGKTLESGQLTDHRIVNGSFVNVFRKCAERNGTQHNGGFGQFNWTVGGIERDGVCVDRKVRGVVCLGEPSNQVYKTAPFLHDASIDLKPFIVELRMAPRYSLVD